MTFSNAIKSVLRNYAVFRGRASRSEYWYWILALVVLGTVFAIIDGALISPVLGFEAFDPDAGQPLSLVLNLATLLPSLAVSVRRLHDTGRSGWWLFISLIPIIGLLVLLWWYVQPGSKEPNQFD